VEVEMSKNSRTIDTPKVGRKDGVEPDEKNTEKAGKRKPALPDRPPKLDR
jgi:hypothetical protein